MAKTSGDIFTIYKPIYKLSTYLGYAPFVIKEKPSKRYLKYRKLQSIIVGLIQLGTILNLCTVSQYSLKDIKFTSLLLDTTRSLSIITPSVSVIIQIITRRVYAKEFIAILNKLYEIDEKLNAEFKIKLSYKKLAIVAVLPLFTGLLDLFFITPDAYSKDNSYLITFSTSIYYGYLLLSLTIIVVEFFTIILIFRSIFARIRQFLITGILNQTTDITHAEILQNLSSIHQDLCRLLRRYNRTISFQILMVFAYIYSTSSLCIFTLILSINNGSKFLLFPNTFEYLPVIVCTLILIKLGYLTMISSSCRNELYSLENVLKKIYILKDLRLKKEVYAFCLQLLHEKLDISAGGFFQIDCSIIFSMVGAIVTHTIILVQFDPKFTKF